MSEQKYISSPQVADPKDVKAGLVSAVASIILLMILLFLITYQIADPPAQDVVVTAEAVIDEILLKDLKLESGSIGGGSPSNDRVDKPKEQIQEIITGKSKRSSDKSGKSNKTNGNDANNEASTTVQSQDPFGSGGSGGKNGAGNGPFSGPGNSDDGDGGLGKGNGESRLRISNANLPQYDIDYESNIGNIYATGLRISDNRVIDYKNRLKGAFRNNSAKIDIADIECVEFFNYFNITA